jgi:hypothetical protein
MLVNSIRSSESNCTAMSTYRDALPEPLPHEIDASLDLCTKHGGLQVKCVVSETNTKKRERMTGQLT